ncbi:alkaline phosphatase [Parafrankia soli]|uniref:Alkaline phosphatase n=1 Tax=Parafrankia soli TaxID=2599596 RepID=A0A1S1QZR0_9ACTN|nr:CAP domain-containing protein [Parafrankia soli]OHV38552.1 alkaline phosphatase [Parafrankia soli]
MTELVSGANLTLPGPVVALSLPGPFDVTALVLGPDGRVSGDRDMIFYNQPTGPGVTLRATAGVPSVELDLDGLRPGGERVVLVASPSDGATPFGRLPPPLATLRAAGRTIATLRPPRLGTQTALQLAELYRRDRNWKIRALGLGYADGLAGLARDFGVDVSADGGVDAGPAGGVSRAPDGGDLAEVVALTNVERARGGLVALVTEPRLAAAAHRHSADMATRGFFAHDTPDGITVADRVLATGYSYAVVAENIAAGQRTAAEVVAGWMNSPPHRANILRPEVRQTGVARFDGGEYGVYWTQVFGTPR